MVVIWIIPSLVDFNSSIIMYIIIVSNKGIVTDFQTFVLLILHVIAASF